MAVVDSRVEEVPAVVAAPAVARLAIFELVVRSFVVEAFVT